MIEARNRAQAAFHAAEMRFKRNWIAYQGVVTLPVIVKYTRLDRELRERAAEREAEAAAKAERDAEYRAQRERERNADYSPLGRCFKPERYIDISPTVH